MARFRSAGPRLCLAGLAALFGLAGLSGLPTRASQGGEIDPKPRIVFEFSGIRQFGLAVLDDKDKKNAITLAPNGNTNSTVLRIDGKDVEFGSKEGKFLELKAPLGDGKKGEKSVWAYEDVQVTQTLQVVPSKKEVNGKRLLDTALITYDIKNAGQKEREIGLRVMIDTLIVDNDGNPFVIAGKETDLLTTSADLKDKDVPPYVKALREADLKEPGFIAYFSLKVGDGIQPPDRFVITTWPGTTPVWDIQVKNIMGDSSVVLYWNPAKMEPGASRRVGFAYGGGEVSLGKAPEPKD
jgi:hypothetical protein